MEQDFKDLDGKRFLTSDEYSSAYRKATAYVLKKLGIHSLLEFEEICTALHKDKKECSQSTYSAVWGIPVASPPYLHLGMLLAYEGAIKVAYNEQHELYLQVNNIPPIGTFRERISTHIGISLGKRFRSWKKENLYEDSVLRVQREKWSSSPALRIHLPDKESVIKEKGLERGVWVAVGDLSFDKYETGHYGRPI